MMKKGDKERVLDLLEDVQYFLMMDGSDEYHHKISLAIHIIEEQEEDSAYPLHYDWHHDEDSGTDELE